MYYLKTLPYMLLSLFVWIPSGNTLSQSLLPQETINLKAGIFYRNTMKTFVPGAGGSNCLWDFTDLDISRSSHKVIQQTDSLGQIVVADDRRVIHYIVRGDSLLEMGYETPLKEMSYYKPLCCIKYPMELGDSISKDFGGYGTYCGDHCFKESGFYKVVVDGMGDIILSETDTLKNSIRIYKLKSYSIAMDINPSKIDSSQLKQVIEEKYEWYVKGYGKPVFETTTSTSYLNLSPLGTTQYAYCNLPEYQMYNVDEDNEEETNTNKEESSQDIFHYNVNVNGHRVEVNYSLDAKANITMLISDYMGIIYYSQRFTLDRGLGYQAHFDIGNLRPDVYILYINVNGKTYHEKIKKS
ncbi:hypothetical protein [Prevotella dentasini]|uniref:hypothetical protein n=1 Tax=Prevotella dentasini TaxID=589537 RepID=UPI0011DCCEE2|nr:hypothetical protein [Prevotella dentasini]